MKEPIEKQLHIVYFEYYVGKPKEGKRADKSYTTPAYLEDGVNETEIAHQAFRPNIKGITIADCVVTLVRATPVVTVLKAPDVAKVIPMQAEQK